ncbi:MAG TPA: L-seryl-tRNA(Sec) selenium transferase [Thermoanaerobaculia bacterium]|nr:L-seryl-tRNA(Sec) selenium transferase [Thermoanaerobaculia bacterium]
MASSTTSSTASPAARPADAADAPANPRRRLPAVGEVMARAEVQALVVVYGRERVLVQVRGELDRLRAEPERLRAELDRLRAGSEGEEGPEAGARLEARLREGLESAAGLPLRRTINATGIFIHTNLGRAPLPPEVTAALAARLEAGCDLELDLETGRRGDRNRRLERLLCLITGAEAAVVVNNNAAALVLAVACLARDREVVVSRGELVEIGGSFRVPDVLEAAGGRLVEVGTTNRTRLDDYARAIGPETGLLLKVQPSNYLIVGFTESVEEAALAGLSRASGVPLLVDEGSGLLAPHSAPQLAAHPSHRSLIDAGCDLVCGSGDKVLGGPQAGLLVGRRELIGRCRRHPLFRALRPGRGVIATLDAVLRRHLAGDPMPLDRMWPAPEEHRRRLEQVAQALGAEVVEADAYLGGGAAPEDAIEGHAIAVEGAGDLLRRLRVGEPPVVGYARGGRVILDLRTVDPDDDDVLIQAVGRARDGVSSGG